jgi:crossover junction endodeoxyribonuclease RuvC
MYIIGIDQSLTSTGIVCLENDKIKNQFLISSEEKGVERLIEIKEKVKNILNNQRPNIVVLEGYSFGSRGRATFSLGELGGILKVLITELNYRLYIVPSTTWKKFITDKGNCKKDLVLMKVFKKYNVEFNDNNLCDAFCLAKFIQEFHKFDNLKSKKFTKSESETFKKYIPISNII